MNEEPKICTTSGRPVDVVRAEQTEKTGQHKDYIVLCPDERAKGFVRPFRNKYTHVGRAVCAKTFRTQPSWEPPRLGGNRYLCTLKPDHEGECGSTYVWVSYSEQMKMQETHRKGGCGVETVMGTALSETYARDPKFYGATFCAGCNRHLPVSEFVWSQDGETVGS